MRKDIQKREQEIRNWIEEKQSKAFICRQLKCKPETLSYWLKILGIEYSGNRGAKGIKQSHYRKSAKEYMRTENPKTYKLKQKLIEDKIKEAKCERCKNKTWNNKPIPLELHHKDGNRFNNSLDNLEVLCPNCHAQEPNNSGANKGKYQAGVPERHREQT